VHLPSSCMIFGRRVRSHSRVRGVPPQPGARRLAGIVTDPKARVEPSRRSGSSGCRPTAMAPSLPGTGRGMPAWCLRRAELHRDRCPDRRRLTNPAANRGDTADEAAPALPENYMPRGSPARAAAPGTFDRDTATQTQRHADRQTRATPLLWQSKRKAALARQQD
jgi:hypothetical protein